jgi:hypothetical protein
VFLSEYAAGVHFSMSPPFINDSRKSTKKNRENNVQPNQCPGKPVFRKNSVEGNQCPGKTVQVVSMHVAYSLPFGVSLKPNSAILYIYIYIYSIRLSEHGEGIALYSTYSCVYTNVTIS